MKEEKISATGKTALTKRMEVGMIMYLKNMGFFIIETEVSIHRKWKADIVAIANPSKTVIERLSLPKRKDLPLPITAAIEIKRTAEEVWSDDNKFCRTKFYTDISMIVLPHKEINRIQTYPDWYLVGINENGMYPRMKRKGSLKRVTPAERCWFLYRFLVRRNNRTELKFFREQQKKWGMRESHRNTTMRLSNAISIVAEIVDKKPINIACTIEKYCRGYIAPDWLLDELETLVQKQNKEVDDG